MLDRISLLLFLHLVSYLQVSPIILTNCSDTIIPSNSVVIFNSRTSNEIQPDNATDSVEIPGWTLLDQDEQMYTLTRQGGGIISISWAITITVDDCSPEYSICPVANDFTQLPDVERNWILTSYYETEANNIELRIQCSSMLSFFRIDCRSAIRAYFYESDQNLTDVSSLIDQFIPTQEFNGTTGDGFKYFTFTKTKRGFFIGFLGIDYCFLIDRFLFYYFQCPAVTASLYSLNATLAPNSTQEPLTIPIPYACPNESQITPAQCFANGSWIPPADSATCECNAGFYRGEGEATTESCGKSPSVVQNVRIVRPAVGPVVSWDMPSYLGNRGIELLSYRISYYQTVSTQSSFIRYEITATEFNFNNTLNNSTEYEVLVTSLNTINSVSDVYNNVSVILLSSFPVISSPDYSNNRLTWQYTLYAVNQYQFQVGYVQDSTGDMQTSNVSAGTCKSLSEYARRCSVFIPDLNSSLPITITLLNPSGPNSVPIFETFNIVPVVPMEDPNLIIYIVSGVSGLLIFSLLLLIICCCVICCCRVRRREDPIHKDSELIPLHAQLYQDPNLYDDLNKAVRALAKEIDPSEIEKDSIIGVGEFGDVWKGNLVRHERKIPVALKILKPASIEKNKDDFFKEASVMGQFSHPNVIFLYGVTLRKPIMIVTPFMENGSLDKYLISHMNNVPFPELVAICYGVSRGMVYLSLLGFVHRDLASRNILLDKDLTPKITDFGLSRETEEDFYRVQTGGKIPVRWTAPEAILYRKFNTASDMWSFGVLMWEVMSYGQTPYGDTDNFTIMDELQKGYRLPAPDNCPSVIYTLMLSCWNKLPEQRPSFTDIQQSLLQIINTNKARPTSSTVKVNTQNPLNHTSLESWLTSLKLERYAANFRDKGYSQISSVWHMSEAELFDIGIIPVGHRNKIMTSIHRANNQLCFTYSVPL